MKKILVVDDNRLSRELLRVILELEGCLVEEVNSGLAALKALEDGTKPDLIFMDCSMPDLDGVSAAKQMLNAAPDLKLVGMSAAGEIRREECLSAGMIGYIHKPFDRSKILELLSFKKRPSSGEPSVSL